MDESISCIIVEDDPVAADMAKGIVNDIFPQIQVLAIIPDIATAKQQLLELAPDFIILDVNLEDGDAFSLLKRLGEIPFKIVFTTSFDAYALEAIKYSALDYLLKPYAPEELKTAIEKVVQQLQKEQYQQQLQALFYNIETEKRSDKKLVLKNLDTIHIVQIKDIIYIQSDSNYSSFYLENGKKIVVSKTLKFYEERLKGLRFFRIHQRYLINLDHIQTVDRKEDQVVLSGIISLPISQSRKKMLFSYLSDLS